MTKSKSCSVYIHWPYCKTKCTYCAFNKYTLPDKLNHNRLQSSFVLDLQYELNRYDDESLSIPSVYFGGGTPSLAKPEFISQILNLLNPFTHIFNPEITLEINPLDASSPHKTPLHEFKSAGINRVSIGVESLSNSALKSFNRNHSVQDALDTVKEAQSLFDNVSIDLIYGRRHSSLKEWEMELKSALKWNPQHLSIYQLMIENGTPMYTEYNQFRHEFPSEDECADMYESTVRVCKEFGYEQYEVSSFARQEMYQSRHNASYWDGMDYIGIGPGAHGRVSVPPINEYNTLQSTQSTQSSQQSQTTLQTFRILDPKNWINSCESIGHGIRKTNPLSFKQSLVERIVFGLRCKKGVKREYLSPKVVDWNQIEEYKSLGLLQMNDERLQPTEKGISVLDSILSRILL